MQISSDEKATLLLCSVDDVSEDTPARALVNDQPVAVFRRGQSCFVTQDLCTHGPGLLSEGYVEGDEVECPFHQGRFNFVTGAPTAAPCTVALRTWQATVRDGKVWVDPTQHANAREAA